ncbi:MAG: hypothetical protein K6G90_03810 [Clostridia bacterium]|nr:hypothetical protein [Clostridia bacterium]
MKSNRKMKIIASVFISLAVILVVAAVLLFFFYGRKPGNNADAAVAAFSSGDINAINELIFGTKGLETDPDLSEIWGEQPESKEGVLEYIFKETTVSVRETTDTTIVYDIEALDMTGVFSDPAAEANSTSEEQLLQYIKDYADKTDKKTITVTMNYSTVDKEMVVNYRNHDFINAVTGGLLDAYQSLYEKMLDEYTEG